MEKNRYIRFDWAAKYRLRNKADFAIFEGFIFVLLGESVTIEKIIDGEWNLCSFYGKYRRVIIKAYNSKGDKIIIEIRQAFELDHLERWVYSEGLPHNISPDNPEPEGEWCCYRCNSKKHRIVRRRNRRTISTGFSRSIKIERTGIKHDEKVDWNDDGFRGYYAHGADGM